MNLEKVELLVNELLDKKDLALSMSHIKRVLNLSLKFAEKERTDKNI